MKSAFWLFVGLLLGFGLSYVAYLKAERGPRFAFAAEQAEVDEMRQAADRVAQRQPAPRDRRDQELKSSFGRYMMDLLENVQGGTAEERRLIQDTLRENDETLHEILEEDLSQKIRSANNRHGRVNPAQKAPPRQPRNFVERPSQTAAQPPADKNAATIDPKDAI